MDADDDTVLAALRSYPLFDFDRKRVETRAFFLSESTPDPLKNWLDESPRSRSLKKWRADALCRLTRIG
jgi:hypothetical protein